MFLSMLTFLPTIYHSFVEMGVSPLPNDNVGTILFSLISFGIEIMKRLAVPQRPGHVFAYVEKTKRY